MSYSISGWKVHYHMLTDVQVNLLQVVISINPNAQSLNPQSVTDVFSLSALLWKLMRMQSVKENRNGTHRCDSTRCMETTHFH